MNHPTSPNVEMYRKAIREHDPATASLAWRNAQAPGKEAERNAMIQTLDFSLVENYSMAQTRGDLDTMSAIWSKALHAPDTALAWFLDTISKRNLEADLPPEESETEAKDRNQKARNLLDQLLSQKGPAKTAPAPTHPAPSHLAQSQKTTSVSQPNVPVSELLAFAEEPARRSFCGLNRADIESLRGIGQLLLPLADSPGPIKQWASDHQLSLTESQIGKIHKASLLLQNQMIPSDASMLAMAARSARGKKDKGSDSSPESIKDAGSQKDAGSPPSSNPGSISE